MIQVNVFYFDLSHLAELAPVFFLSNFSFRSRKINHLSCASYSRSPRDFLVVPVCKIARKSRSRHTHDIVNDFDHTCGACVNRLHRFIQAKEFNGFVAHVDFHEALKTKNEGQINNDGLRICARKRVMA